MERRGYAVEADLPGKKTPDPVYGHIPDLKAVLGNDGIVGEVETCDSISWTETRDQFVAFSKARDQGWSFHACAPKRCLGDLKAQVEA